MDSYPPLGPPSAAQVLQLDNYNNDEGYTMKDEELPVKTGTRPNDAHPGARITVAGRLIAALSALLGVAQMGMWIVNPIADALKAAGSVLGVLLTDPKALLEAAKVQGLVVDLPVPGALVVLQLYPNDVYWLAVVESVHDGAIAVYATQSFRLDVETEMRLITLPVPNHDDVWKTIAYINFDKE